MDFFKESMEIGMAPSTPIFEDVYICKKNVLRENNAFVK